eukprot:GHVS01022925.1.p1 GENE.GHVS01022925.1~~GHVS01022925.1.p1  ORF type:complete len:118 (-),score=25.21 GHVS01022925.1:78-431(-)
MEPTVGYSQPVSATPNHPPDLPTPVCPLLLAAARRVTRLVTSTCVIQLNITLDHCSPDNVNNNNIGRRLPTTTSWGVAEMNDSDLILYTKYLSYILSEVTTQQQHFAADGKQNRHLS